MVQSETLLRKVLVSFLFAVCLMLAGAAVYAQTLSARVDAETAQTQLVPIEALLKTAAPPTAPSAPGTKDITSSSITWTWTDNSNDESAFKIWADPGSGIPVTLQAATEANVVEWRQSGLLSNTLYTFQVASTAMYLDSARTSPYSAWTQAAEPAAPVVGNAKKTSLGVSVNQRDGNPAHTEYALMCATTGQWLATGGAMADAPEYHTAAAWGAVTVAGLTPATAYSFVAVARNAVGVVTIVGPLGKGSTLTTVPNVVAMTRLQAQSAISGAKLVGGIFDEAYNNVVPVGTVVSQSPAAGADAAPGTSVNLVLSLGPAPVTVPGIVGLPRAQAQAAITGVQLAIGVVGEEYSVTVPAGNVVLQLPVAGTQAARGSTVNFMVSLGPAPVEVPALAGLTLAQAEAAVTVAGLAVGTTNEDYSNSAPLGSVIAQVPAAGWLVPAGTAVNLTTSKGIDPNITVPNVVGLARAQAETSLVASHLATGALADAYNGTLPVGTVLSQYPAAGAKTAAGTAVNLVINRGAAPVPVPNVLTLTRVQANASLTTAGLVLGAVTEAFSTTVAAGQVMQQNPVTGVQVAPGTPVDIVLSAGSAGGVVPNLAGFSRNAAENTLLDAGLSVGKVTFAASTTVASGDVISQNPAAGTQVAAGASVSLVVSRGSDGEVEVPELVGLAREQAETVVVNASLVVGGVAEEASDSVEAGVVLKQTPMPGTVIASGTAVNLTVSSGPDDNGCGCLQLNSQKFSLSGAKKSFGDFFLMGLSLVTLLTVTRNTI